MGKLKEIVKKFASASTVIGLTRIVRAETTFMKITWVLMTLISLAFGLYLTFETNKGYLQYDVFTQTKRIQANSSLMPSISFCFRDSETKNVTALFSRAEFSTENGPTHKLIGDRFESFGDCIRFNHFTNKSDNRIFTANMLSDRLYFRVHLKFRIVDVFVSDNYDNVLDYSKYASNSFNVKGSYFYNFEKILEFKLEEPYNRCQNISDVTYRQTNCLVQCKNIKFTEKYNCTLRNFYSIPGSNFCTEGIAASLEFDADCERKCPKECSLTKFDALVNNPYVSVNFSDFLEFRFHYLDLSYIEISETPKMSGYSLLNEIGGALGLFVGVTFLSFLESIEFFVEIFLAFYK